VAEQTSKLVRLTWKDRDAAAAVLGRAFTEYELLRYYFPDEKQRPAAARTFCFIALSVCLKYGEAYASSEKMEGIAGWLPPGSTPFTGWQVFRSVPLSVLFRFAWQGAYRMRAYDRYLMNLHRKLALGPHWYLHIIGVDPAYQGQGLASRLVRPVLEGIDQEQMPCLVETHRAKNVNVYRRFGFEVIVEDKIPGTELTSFTMLREVQTAL